MQAISMKWRHRWRPLHYSDTHATLGCVRFVLPGPSSCYCPGLTKPRIIQPSDQARLCSVRAAQLQLMLLPTVNQTTHYSATLTRLGCVRFVLPGSSSCYCPGLTKPRIIHTLRPGLAVFSSYCPAPDDVTAAKWQQISRKHKSVTLYPHLK
jgi:hypothetical protein